MRLLLTITIILAGLCVLAGCQRWGANNPARQSDNPELQGLRDARRNGLRTRCAECHSSVPDHRPLRLEER